MTVTVIVMLLIGFALLLLGGELLVRGAVDAASRLGVSKLVIGIVLVGFGTSVPEMVTSVQAVYAGSPGIAIGNFVGSNIANILLVLGLSALVATVPVISGQLLRDGAAVIAATVGFIVVCLTIPFDRVVGIAFLAFLGVYLAVTVHQDRRAIARAGGEGEDAIAEAGNGLGFVWAVALALIGMVMVIAGGHVLVDAAIALAKSLSVPDHVIGLTVVAVGTSLPELATCLVAALRGQSEFGSGNLLGSNLFNILAIGGVTAVLAPAAIPIPGHIATVDNFVMLAATILALLFVWNRERVGRLEGALLFGGYIAYMASLWMMNNGAA